MAISLNCIGRSINNEMQINIFGAFVTCSAAETTGKIDQSAAYDRKISLILLGQSNKTISFL